MLQDIGDDLPLAAGRHVDQVARISAAERLLERAVAAKPQVMKAPPVPWNEISFGPLADDPSGIAWTPGPPPRATAGLSTGA